LSEDHLQRMLGGDEDGVLPRARVLFNVLSATESVTRVLLRTNVVPHPRSHRAFGSIVRTLAAATLAVATLIVAPLIVATSSGCGDAASSEVEPPPSRHTLLFIDRSSSTDAYPRAEQIFADSLRRLVRTRMDRPGDRLRLFVVHEKTLSKSPRLDLRNEVRPLEDKPFADEQALEAARFKKETEREIAELLDRAQTFVDRAERGAFSEWTDLWGTLGVASEEMFPDADAVLYYFSDMFESMPGPARRNFDRKPPSDRSQAETWAREDAQRLSDVMIVRPERLQSATVRVVMGPLATKANGQHVKFYWLELFDTVGVKATRYN